MVKHFREAWPYTGADTAKWANMFFCRKYENVNSGRPTNLTGAQELTKD